jgi:hypothetical protein
MRTKKIFFHGRLIKKPSFHINGLFALIDVVVAVLNDEGMSGGGNVEPVVKPTLFDELS